MNEDLKRELKECDTLNEMWIVLDEHYNLDHELGSITKGVVITSFISNLGKLLKATRIPERDPEEMEEEEEY